MDVNVNVSLSRRLGHHDGHICNAVSQKFIQLKFIALASVLHFYLKVQVFY